MHYFIRIVVAIVTFALGAALAGLISPATKSRRSDSSRNCSRTVVNSINDENVEISPEWVFVERDLKWRPVPVSKLPASYGSEVVESETAALESATASVAIFYPSGKFALVTGEIVRVVGGDRVRFIENSPRGHKVHVGSWERVSAGLIETTSDFRATPLDGLDRDGNRTFRQQWVTHAGAVKDQTSVDLYGMLFVRPKNFVALGLLADLIAHQPSSKDVAPVAVTSN